MASNTDETFAQYKMYAGVAIGGVLLAAMLDSCTAPTKEEIAAAKEAKVAAVEEKKTAVETAEATMAANLKPIETVALMEKPAAPAEPRGGAEVYQAACMACHDAGVLNAPKLEPGAWDGRAEKGLAALTQSAINGINAMPPRGGNPDVSDEEISSAIVYMLAESGYEVAEDGATAGAEDSGGKAASSAASMAAVAAAEEAKAAVEAAQAAAAEAKAAAEEAKAAAEAAKAATEAAEAAKATTTTTEPAGEVKAGAEEMSAAPATSVDSIGKQVYDATCFTCHDVGIAGSPMLTDKAAWNTRIGAGIDALYASAINGKGVMPGMDYYQNLNEAQVKAAVDYMLDTAGVDVSADAGTAAQVTEAKTEEATQVAAQPEAEATTEAKTEEAAQEAQPATQAATEEKTEDATQVAQPEAEAATEAKTEEATQATQPEAEAATEAKTEEAAQEAQPAADAAEAATEEKAEDTATQENAMAALHSGIDGEKVYRGICFSCHDSGIAQAPVLGKATAWEARIAAGIDSLYASTINGKGVMPAKGGNPALSDDEIKAAVDWMVQQVQ